jgi:RNA polymerase sigma-B factor
MTHTLSCPSERWLLTRYKRCGDPAAREELTRRMLPLARKIALSYGARGHGDDLQQVAALGLVKAIDRYDPTYGVSLRTYAIPTMSGEVRRYLRDHAWSVHVPRPLKDRALAITKATRRLSATTGRTPTADELAAELDCSVEDVLEGLQVGTAYTATSLYARAGSPDDNEHTLADVLGAEDHRLHQVEQVAVLRSLRDVLDDRDRAVLYLRFVEDLTQTAIAERVGISQMHVSRIVRRSLDRLSQRLEAAA